MAEGDDLQALFGTDRVPAIDVEEAQLHTFALSTVGRTTMSGVQRKISLGLSTDRQTLRVTIEGAQYILKPVSNTFPDLPQNEHASMRIAQACGVRVPAFGLVPLRDGSLAYIVRRFDRPGDGTKLRQEDFCQLSLRGPKDKYAGSAELCVRVVRRYATEPVVELRKLLRQLVVGWLLGNGDMHLKNLSILTAPDGLHRLSPAYDMLSTRLYIPDDRLALPVGGRDDGLTLASFRNLGHYAGIPRRAVRRLLDEIRACREAALEQAERSELRCELAESLMRLLADRFAALEGD